MRWPQIVLLFVVALPATVSLADTRLSWQSATTGAMIECELRSPPSTAAGSATVVYLKNLAVPRLGRESDDAIIGDLLRDNVQVLVLDYARNPKAVSPDLAVDILKLRQDIGGKDRTLLTDQKVDLNRLFIIPAGFRLKRDVEFARDGSRVLAMDIIYPSQPATAVPVLIEITCDNANRMSNSSL